MTMMTSSSPTTETDSVDFHFLRPTILTLLHAEEPQAYSVAPLAEWVALLLLRCVQDGEPLLGDQLLRRFWKELEAAGPLDRLERLTVKLMKKLSLTPAEKLYYGDLWVRLLVEQARWERAERILTGMGTLALTEQERAVYANRMGVFLKERGKFDEGERYLQEALSLGRQMGNAEREIISLNNLGNLEFNRDRFELSIAYFEAIRAHPEASRFPRWQGAAAAGLAMNWSGQKQFARAAAIMEEAERLYGNHRPGILRVWVNRAYYEAQAGNLPHAFLYGQRALDLSRELKEPRRESFALHNLGVAYYRAGHWQDAIHYLEQALTMRQQLDIALLVETTQEMLAKVRAAMIEQQVGTEGLQQR